MRTEDADEALPIVLGGTSTAAELVARGRYDWVNGWITRRHFRIKKHPFTQHLVEFITYAHVVSTEEVLVDFKRRKLVRPTPEDAFYFGIQHPGIQRMRPIAFLHHPVRGPLAHDYVIVLGGSKDQRIMGLYRFDNVWSYRYAFAGIRLPPPEGNP